MATFLADSVDPDPLCTGNSKNYGKFIGHDVAQTAGFLCGCQSLATKTNFALYSSGHDSYAGGLHWHYGQIKC